MPLKKISLTATQTGEVHVFDTDKITIGRKRDNTISIRTDLKMSRSHAAIYKEKGAYFIQDMGSANGTLVNEERISEARPLKAGDKIQVGDTRFTVDFISHIDDTLISSTPPAANMLDDKTQVQSEVASPTPDFSETGTYEVRMKPPTPYVGPRTFTQDEAGLFFGREYEAAHLLSMVISERLVLFYAQSGAGKSSLINTRLTPGLRKADFSVLPIGRVSGGLPKGITTVNNIFAFNLMLSLDEGDSSPGQFINLTLFEFLERLTTLDGENFFMTLRPASNRMMQTMSRHRMS